MRLLVPAALLALLLAGCSDDPPPPSALRTSPPVTATAGPSPAAASPAATAGRSTDEGAGAEGGVVLGGEDLGVTRLGAPMDEAVAAVTAVLGAPDEDPAGSVSCITADREVRWGAFRLAAQGDRLAGWTSQAPTLSTPSGVAVGTTLGELQRVYGDRLRRIPANPDNAPGFGVEGADVLGSLSSAGDDAVVTALFSSFCSGP